MPRIKNYVWAIIGLLAVLSLSIVFAGRDGHVSVLHNTGRCGGQNCETVYQVCGNGETLLLDATNGYFTYRSNSNTQLRTNNSFVEGTGLAYWVNDTENFACSINNVSSTCQRNIWRSLAPFDRQITPNECVKLRVTGNFDTHKYAWIDNVLNLNIGGIVFNYAEFITWNASNVTVFYEFNQSLNDSSGNNNVLEGQGSAPAHIDEFFNTTVYKIGNASWQGCPQTSGSDCSALNRTPKSIPLGTSNFSMVVWARYDSVLGGTNRIMSMGGNLNNCNDLYRMIALNYVTGGINQTSVTGCGYSSTYNIQLNASTWYLFVLTYNATDKNLRLFINGDKVKDEILANALNICGGTNDASCAIMLADQINQPNVQASWKDQLDDFRIFNQVLNATQIRNLYNRSNGWGLLSLDGELPAQVNNAPTITKVNFSTATTLMNQSLTANATYTDADSDLGTVFFNWSVNGVTKRLTNFSSVASGVVLNDTLPTGSYGVGQNITLNVSATDGTVGSTVTTLTRQVSPNPNYVPYFTVNPAITPATVNSNSSLNCSFTPYDDVNTSIYANITWWHDMVLNGTFNNRVLCTNSTTCTASQLVTGNLGVWTNWSCSVGLDEGTLGVLNFTNSSLKQVQNYQPKIQRLAFFNITGVLGVSFRVQADVDIGGNDNDIISANFSYNGLYYPMSLGTNWSVLVNTTATTQTGNFTWNITVQDSFANSTTLSIRSRPINLTDDVRNTTANRQVALPVIAFSNNNYSVSLIDSVLVSNGNLLSKTVVQNHTLIYANYTTLAVYNQSGNNISYQYNTSGWLNWSQTLDLNSSQVFNVTYNVTALELYPSWQNCTATTNLTGKCILTMNITNRLPFIIDDFTVRFTDDELPHFTKKSGDLRVFFNIINGSGGGQYMNNLLLGTSGINRNFSNYEWFNVTPCSGQCIQGDPQSGESTTSNIWGLVNASRNNLTVSLNSTVINGTEITNFVLGSVTTTQDIGGLSTYQYQVVYDYDEEISDPVFLQGGGGGGGATVIEVGNYSADVNRFDALWIPLFQPSKTLVINPNRVTSHCTIEGFPDCTVAGDRVFFTLDQKSLKGNFFEKLEGMVTMYSVTGDISRIPVLVRVINPLGVYELRELGFEDPTNVFFRSENGKTTGVRLWWVLLGGGVALWAFFKKR